MKPKFFLAVLTLLSLPLAAFAQIIPPTTYAAGQPPVVISGSSTIDTNSNTVTVSAGATVTYQASTSIDLKPGFHAVGNFYAMIGSTVDTDGDGLPDVWERAHGLNPANPADAQTTTSGGLTYLLEYKLGTTTTTTKQTDTGNSTQLNVHLPRTP